MKKLTLFFALLLGMFLFPSVETHAAEPRVMAYDLHLDPTAPAGFVRFCYTLNTDAEKVYIIMYSPNGEVAWRRDITSETRRKKGAQSWTFAQLDLPSFKGMTWAIEAQGNAIGSMKELTDNTRGIYNFYHTRGVVVDNNPESDHFSTIYVQASKNGATDGSTTRADNQKAGIFIYNQELDELNLTENVGVQPTLPNGYTMGDDANKAFRLAIDPKTNNLSYCYAVKNQPAVFSFSTENMPTSAGNAINLLEGVQSEIDITIANALCYDENGVLYVIVNEETGYLKGRVLQIKDNKATVLAESSKILVDANCSLVSDGRGGLWVAQKRGGISSYSIIYHINIAKNTVDFVLSSDGDYADWFSGNCYRGAVAYNPKEDILAVSGAKCAMLFKVTYDVTTGVPSITKWIKTANLGTSSTFNVDGLAFDYAGDLYVVSSSSERFYKFVIPTNNNTCITPAKKSSTFDGAPVARVFAYGLNVVDNGNSYTFSFTPNATAKSGRIIVYNGETKVQVKEFAIDAPITKGVKKEVTISKWNLPKLAGMTWAVELTGEKVESLAVLNNTGDTDTYRFYRPQGVAIDNNPESDFFGRMYIAYPEDNDETKHKEGIVVFDPLHTSLKSTSINIKPTGVGAFSNGQYEMHRIAVNPVNNKVYYTKSMTGTAIYEMTPNATNVLSDGGTAKNVISGITAITNANSLCFDEEGTMYVLANANYSGGYTGKIYKVSNGTATEFTTQSYDWAAKDNAIVSDGRGGFWVAQHRDNFGSEDVLSHINSVGVRDFYVDKNTNANLLVTAAATSGKTNASYRGQIAYYQIDTNTGILAFGGGKVVSLFNVSYSSDGVPTLEKLTKTGTIGTNIDGLAFDYAGNLVVLSASSERFYHYTVPTDNNVCITPAKSTLTINGPGVSVPRVFAYNLKSELVTPGYDQYRLSFKSNVPYKSGNIVFLNEAGVQVGEKLVITANPMIINRADLPADMVNWGVELSSDRCTSVDEYTDASKGIYDFYNPQGIAVDNSPESNYFGQIYIAAATNGDATKGKTARTKNQKRGVFVYSPDLKELNPTNVGFVPNNVTFTTTDVHEMHRIAVNPITHEVAFAYNIQDNAAVWNMNPADWTGAATNLINNVSQITRANSLCFDASGVLYVMDRAHTDNGGGTIYKIQNGTATKVIQSAEWAQQHNAMVSDGRGGLWVAQYRGSLDSFAVLSHINSTGVMDLKVDNGADATMKALFSAENGKCFSTWTIGI